MKAYKFITNVPLLQLESARSMALVYIYTMLSERCNNIKKFAKGKAKFVYKTKEKRKMNKVN